MAGKKSAERNGSELVGREVDDLSLPERLEYANKWVAFRIYTPPGKVTRDDGVEYVDVRLRKIAAAGDSIEDCLSQLRRQNLSPAEFEFTILKPPY